MARRGVCPDIVFLISLLSKDAYENARDCVSPFNVPHFQKKAHFDVVKLAR